MIDIGSFAGLGGIPLVVALTAFVKQTIPSLSERYYPAVSLVWGIALNLALAYLLGTDWRVSVLVGVVTGLGASGLYQYGKGREQALPSHR